MARIDRWKEPKFIDPLYTTVDDGFTDEDKTAIEFISRVSQPFDKNAEEQQISESLENKMADPLRAAKELIYDISDGKPVFHIISYSFNVRIGNIQISHLQSLSIEGNSQQISDTIRYYLALAHINEIPVYPNNDKLAEELAEYYRGSIPILQKEGEKAILFARIYRE